MISSKDRQKLANSKGLRFRVDMMCKDCVYDDKSTGTWRKQTEDCEIALCPLHPVRPRTTK